MLEVLPIVCYARALAHIKDVRDILRKEFHMPNTRKCQRDCLSFVILVIRLTAKPKGKRLD